MSASGANFSRDIKLTFWDNFSKALTADEASNIRDLYDGSIGNFINAGMKQFIVELTIGELDNSNSNETYNFKLQTSSNSDFSVSANIVTHAETSVTRGYSGMDEIAVPKVGPRAKFKRYMRILLESGGTTPEVENLSAALICREQSNEVIIHDTYDYGS